MLSQAGRADSPQKVPMEFSAELFFDDGISASFYCSFLTEHQQWCNISGTKGNLAIKDFVLPVLGNEVSFETCNPEFKVDGCEFVMEDHTRQHKVREYSNSHETAQETNLFRRFAQIVLDGKLDPHWPDIAWKTQVVMDACLESAAKESQPVAVTE